MHAAYPERQQPGCVTACIDIYYALFSFFGISRYAILGEILIPVKVARLFDILSVDGLPVIAHGDHVKSHVLPFLTQFGALFRFAIVSGIVISNQLEHGTLIRVVMKSIIVHAHIAGAVSERKHRLRDCLLIFLFF